jgi:hypothetical protein
MSFQFNGRLTLQVGSPKPAVDQIGKSILWLTPAKGATVPVIQSGTWTDARFLTGPTDQNGWQISTAALGSGKYHVYATASGLLIGSAWTNPDTELTRFDGIRVRSGTLETWLGSINVTDGLMSCHLSMGQDRHWDVYNGHNKEEIRLRVMADADVYYCPENQYPAWQPFNNNAANRAVVFTGAPEAVDVEYCANTFINSLTGAYGIINVVGWNGVASGSWDTNSADNTETADARTGIARYTNPAAVGVNTATMFIAAAVNSDNRNSAAYGSFPTAHPTNPELNCQLIAAWQG